MLNKLKYAGTILISFVIVSVPFAMMDDVYEKHHQRMEQLRKQLEQLQSVENERSEEIRKRFGQLKSANK